MFNLRLFTRLISSPRDVDVLSDLRVASASPPLQPRHKTSGWLYRQRHCLALSGPSRATAPSVKLTSRASLAKRTEQRGSRLQCKPPPPISLSLLQTDVTSWRRKAALSPARSCSPSFKTLMQTQRSARQTAPKAPYRRTRFRCGEGFSQQRKGREKQRERAAAVSVK